MWNLESWVGNPEYHSRNPESHERLKSRIQVLLTNTGIQYQESGIHGVESRIQDCPGFPYMGRHTAEVRFRWKIFLTKEMIKFRCKQSKLILDEPDLFI